MTIIPCVHNCAQIPVPDTSSDSILVVKIVYDVSDNLVYPCDDGSDIVLAPPRPRRVPAATSDDFNPLCPACARHFINEFTNHLDFSYAYTIQLLYDLRDDVWERLGDLETRHVDHDFLYCKVSWVETWYTFDPADYAEWLQLEKVEYEEMVPEGSRWREENCAVCLEELGPAATKEEQPVVMKLPCQHGFHGSCIVEWLLRSTSHVCPLCRFELPTLEE